MVIRKANLYFASDLDANSVGILYDFSLIVDKPENHVYQSQHNVYQLLSYDGKSNAHGQWEPPAYQGLAKGTSEGNWSEGEVYTNPSMYQDLKTNEAASNGEYLPAYHPLMKSTVCDSIPIEFGLIASMGLYTFQTVLF